MASDEAREAMDHLMANADPEMVAKFGDPRDENDPRNWTPTERIEKGVSLEEQVRLLGLDMEMTVMTVGQLVRWRIEQERKVLLAEFKDKIKTDPEGAIKQLMGLIDGGESLKGSWGPLENDPNSSVRYAGSTDGISPDQTVETPQGLIRADQIPGYRNDPSWKPSPDWVEANCMCPAHQEQRKHSNQFGIDPFKDDDGPGFGQYL